MTTTRAIRDLNLTIEALRNEETSLITGSDKLLAYGITSHVNDVTARLRAIKTQALGIAQHLNTLGAYQAAQDAADGWAIIMPPTGTRPEVTP